MHRRGLMRPRSTTYGQGTAKEEIMDLQTRIAREMILLNEDAETKAFFTKLARLSLTVIGVEDANVELFINNLATQVSKPRAKANGLLDETTTNQLKDIISSTQQFLESRVRLEHIIRVQSRVRGWLVRKRFKNISKEAFNILKSRNQVFGELLKTEHQYTEAIEAIIKEFLEPVRSSLIEQKPLMETQDMAIVFCNIETIFSTHTKILESLKELTNDWPFVDGIGKLFLRIAPSLKVYGVYVQNFKLAMDTLDRLAQTKGGRWKAFVDAKKEPAKPSGGKLSAFKGSVIGSTSAQRSAAAAAAAAAAALASNAIQDRDIRDLLRMPLDRISKYESFLHAIEQSTPPDHPDLQDIVSASALMKQTCAFVAQSLEQADHRAKILGVQRRLVGYEGPLNLLEAKRFFCFEGSATVTVAKAQKTTVSKRYLFVFNNLVIITKHIAKGYQVKKLLHLSSDDDILDQPDTPNAKHNFILLHGGIKYQIAAKSSEEKAQFLASLTVSLQQQKRDRVFGIPLADLLEREGRQNGVPKVVEDIVNYFDSHQEMIQIEGIFRQSGLKEVIEDFKAKYNQREKVDLAQAKTPHDISGLLKMFIRELPEPLFPFNTYTKLMNLYDELNGPVGDPTPRGLLALTEICEALPKANANLLQYLCAFLSKVTNHSEVNKMTSHNISIVFGPNVIRPAVETIETSLELPKVNFAFKVTLEYWRRVFGLDPPPPALASVAAEAAAAAPTFTTLESPEAAPAAPESPAASELSESPSASPASTSVPSSPPTLSVTPAS